MRVRFWGTRGSLPVALTAQQVRSKIADALLAASGRCFADEIDALRFIDDLPFHRAQTYGGHSSCVELELAPGDGPQAYVLCDLGTGARPFGHQVMARHGSTPQEFHVFMSHVHWDHIMGFPLFAPAYLPGNRIHIYGCHAELEAAFRRQHGAPSFPVTFEQLGAAIDFIQLEPGRRYSIAGLQVTPLLQRHAGDSYGYRFDTGTRSVVYSTDSEHKLEQSAELQRFIEFFDHADLVIFDAMYSFAESISVKEDWGHSSNVIGVEMCQLAGAKHLVMFHHEPIFDDARIAEIDLETRRFEEITRDDRPPLRVTTAYDGLVIDLQ